MPADLGVAEFCTFLGAYLPSVKEMRLVRREGAKHQCLVFLRLDSVKQAALFYKDFNGKPVRVAQHISTLFCPSARAHRQVNTSTKCTMSAPLRCSSRRWSLTSSATWSSSRTWRSFRETRQSRYTLRQVHPCVSRSELPCHESKSWDRLCIKVAYTVSGQTELPTCPVCLDRLDQHISGGVVTTVRLLCLL